MKISVFGLGYVGSVSLGCLARMGHTVVGVDVNPLKVDFINEGKSPIVETEISEIIHEQRKKGAVSATATIKEAILNTDVTFICVGTPSTAQGHLNLDGIFRVARDIGSGITEKRGFHVIAIRSTVMPGTNETVTEIIEQASGKKRSEDFSVVSNPEFLREGTAVYDYFNPPYTLIGASEKKAVNIMREVYKNLEAPLIETAIRTAEMIKYVNNSFHALKIAFANEVGAICKSLGVNSHELMEIFCRDTKLNISPHYLKPGFAYGGSCLPKDLKAFCTIAHDHYLKCPILENIHVSNEALKESVLERILSYEKQRIGFLGLSFKAGTDDLRSSPIVDIMEKLLGKGFDIRVYDKNVHLSKLVGANREYILRRIPFIARFITQIASEVVDNSDLVVIVNKDEEFKKILEGLPKDALLLDLANLDFTGKKEMNNYSGVAW
ncbi:MAG TPA: UDP-glucose/GDP-mannose dehydrogenase family protein [Chitinivibrionales bacterium]|nr:UDP-glucose/GDP-mannose dehydrogenase family protein [Chitinivibrionales bacterium]